jgi:hypothetical protein
MGRAFGTHGEKRNSYRVSVGKAERKGPLDVGERMILKRILDRIGCYGLD